MAATTVTRKRKQECEQEARQDRRADRWGLRRQLREITGVKRVRSCGRPGAREDGSVVLRVTEGTTERQAGYAGLFACGNGWLCPVCSVRIAAERADEIARVVGHVVERGGMAELVTLTMRHHAGHALTECWDGVSAGWRAITKSGTYRRQQAAFGGLGAIRAVEVTHGRNGWHVHVHALMVYRGRPSKDARRAMAETMFSAWTAGLVKAGFPAPDREHGLDVQEMDLDAGEGRLFESVTAWAQYIAKGLAAETTMGGAKLAKNGNRTPFQLLGDAVRVGSLRKLGSHDEIATEDLTALALWREYEQGTYRRKRLQWSKPLVAIRDGLGIEDMTDEQIADQELDGENVAVIPSESWQVIERERLACALLDATERGGAAAAHDWLNRHGLVWYPPTRLTDAYGRSERQDEAA